MTKKDLMLVANALRECRHKAAWCFDNDEDYKRIINQFMAFLYPTKNRQRFTMNEFSQYCKVHLK